MYDIKTTFLLSALFIMNFISASDNLSIKDQKKIMIRYTEENYLDCNNPYKVIFYTDGSKKRKSIKKIRRTYYTNGLVHQIHYGTGNIITKAPRNTKKAQLPPINENEEVS